MSFLINCKANNFFEITKLIFFCFYTTKFDFLFHLFILLKIYILKEEAKKERITIAKQMFIFGEPIEKIIKYTGLSKEELQNIANEL